MNSIFLHFFTVIFPNAQQVPYTLEFSLPPTYPHVNCQALVRCNKLSKQQLTEFNAQLKMLV